MITKAMVEIYRRHNGNLDSYDRGRRKHEKNILDTSNWYLIDRFVQDLILIKNGHAADSFTSKVDNSLVEACDNIETILELKRYTTENKERRV